MKRLLYFCIAALMLLQAGCSSAPLEETTPPTLATEESHPEDSNQEDKTVAVSTYTWQLTPQQQETFASARYYILCRERTDAYSKVFSGNDVTNDNGLLTVNFENKILYGKNDFGSYFLPPSEENDTVDGKTHYSIFTVLSGPFDPEKTTDYTAARFSIVLDKASGEVTIESLTAYDHGEDQDILVDGKPQELDPTLWRTYWFSSGDLRDLTRNKEGTILAMEDWPANDRIAVWQPSIANGLEFVYAPLVSGEFYLMFEIEDTAGNRYCSEVMPVESDGQLPQAPEPEPVEIDFTEGDRVRLYQGQGVTVDLLLTEILEWGEDTVTRGYYMEATNDNDFPVNVSAGNLYWGQDIYCGYVASPGTIAPGETKISSSSVDLGNAGTLVSDNTRTDITLTLQITNINTGAYMVYSQPCHITFSEDKLPLPEKYTWQSFDHPAMDAFAGEQVLLETDEVRVTLLGLGGKGSEDVVDDINGALCVENLTDHPLDVSMEGIVINGIFNSISAEWRNIPVGCKRYQYWYLPDYRLEECGITSVETVELSLNVWGEESLNWATTSTIGTVYWCPVELSQSGTAEAFREGDRVLMDKNGVRITLLEEETDYKGYRTWKLAVFNGSQEAISVDVIHRDEATGGPSSSEISCIHMDSYNQVGPGQYAVMELSAYTWEEDLPETVDFFFRIENFLGDSILFYSDDAITYQIKVEV